MAVDRQKKKDCWMRGVEDDVEETEGDWRIQTPCRLELLGPSGSGKSSLILKMIEDDSIFDRPCRHVAYCAPALEDRRNYVEELQNVVDRVGKKICYLTELPHPDQLLSFSQGMPVLVFLDDLPMFENLKGLDSLVGMFARHLNLNLVMAVQNHFLKRSGIDFSFVSRNLTGMIVLGNRADAWVLTLLNTRLCPEKKNFLRDCLADAHENQGCDYIYINLHPHATLSRKLMVATRLFAGERLGPSPLLYVLDTTG